MTPKVYSKRKGADPIPEGAVYVGRPTPWGNPFPLCLGRDNERAVEEYRAWITGPSRDALRADIRRVLRGKDLVCWCQSPSDEHPLPCHATVLLEIANGEVCEGER